MDQTTKQKHLVLFKLSDDRKGQAALARRGFKLSCCVQNLNGLCALELNHASSASWLPILLKSDAFLSGCIASCSRGCFYPLASLFPPPVESERQAPLWIATFRKDFLAGGSEGSDGIQLVCLGVLVVR